jgi:hypothetical protein
METREAVGREPGRDAIPLDAGAHPDPAGSRIDADLLKRTDVQQQGLLHVAERTLVVGGRLGRDAKSGAARVGHRRRDVPRVSRKGDRCRVLVEEEVEGGPGVVPARIAGKGDGARECVGERGGRRGEHAARVGHRAPAVDPANAG